MTNRFSKSNFHKISQEVLDFQLKALYPIQIQNEPDRINLIFLNHDRNFSTFLTIRYLVEHERISDIYALSRSLFESTVTMGLLAKSIIENDLDRYRNYKFSEIDKTYSHLERLGYPHLSGVNSSEINMIRSKRKEYVSKYGKNLSSWTGHSFEENVRFLDKHYPPTCNGNNFYEYLYCQVYRKGSSITHASFGGISKGVQIETLSVPGIATAHRFKSDESHLIFSSFHSLIAFASSIRFMGQILLKPEIEEYYQKTAKYIISG